MKSKKIPSLIFFCSTRDYHAMDWVFSYEKLYDRKPIIFTDSRSGEGLKDLSENYHSVHVLFPISFFLFSSFSKLGSLFRNFLKILLIPTQVIILKLKIKKLKLNKSIFHCHGLYYSLLASLSGTPFICTPQGSEILNRYNFFFYNFFANIILKKSLFITVDSLSMKKKINNLFQNKTYIIQNGIDLNILKKIKRSYHVKRKNAVLSPRGMTPLYQIKEIIYAFNSLRGQLSSLDFCYPFADKNYLIYVKKLSKDKSCFYGRLDRIELYKKYLEYKYVISIPKSDSSPRSVYEAIICGCIVITQFNEYLLALPKIMRERIIVVDIENRSWLKKALLNYKSLKPLRKLDYETKNYLDQKFQMKKILSIVDKYS